MTDNRAILWFGQRAALVMVGVLIAACSAAAPPETSNTAAAEANQPATGNNSLFGETAVSSSSGETANDAPNMLPSDGDMTDDGVPIGFTENGNPYRGDLNAPIVLEEFSDFQ